MFGDSGPERSDHDGEDGHQQDDDQAGVEPLFVLTRVRSVNEELAFRKLLDQVEQKVTINRIEKRRHRDGEVRLILVLLHRQRRVQQQPGSVAVLRNN